MSRRMPAEWEKQTATWVAFPHNAEDWAAQKFECIKWVYADIISYLSTSQKVYVVCQNEEYKKIAEDSLALTHVQNKDNVMVVVHETDRSWLRDSAPTAVINEGKLEWIQWQFNAWAKYANYQKDATLPKFISSITQIPIIPAVRPDNGKPLTLEGGAFDTDGEGTLLVSEECLLSTVQERNEGLTRAGYEEAFNKYLGITKTIWLSRGCVGDDTHGHIDDIARFYAPAHVLLSFECSHSSPNYAASVENLKILEEATDAKNRKLSVIKLPVPRDLFFDGYQLPASYANFYIGNTIVLVPTFNDENDYVALDIIRRAFPTRRVIGINCTDLVLGFGTLHCLSQQQPAVE